MHIGTAYLKIVDAAMMSIVHIGTAYLQIVDATMINIGTAPAGCVDAAM